MKANTRIDDKQTLVEKMQALAGYMREIDTITSASLNGKNIKPTMIVAEMTDAIATEVGALTEERDALLAACASTLRWMDGAKCPHCSARRGVEHDEHCKTHQLRAAIALVRP